MPSPGEAMWVVDTSPLATGPCMLQLSVWVDDPTRLDFMTRQLDQYHGPWVIKQRLIDEQYAVFIPGPRTRTARWHIPGHRQEGADGHVAVSDLENQPGA